MLQAGRGCIGKIQSLCELPHQCCYRSHLWFTRYGDNYLICLPLFHVGALNPLLSIINLGGTATIMSEFDPVKIWEVFGDEQITVTLAVPAMLQFMLLTYDKEAHDTSSLRWVMSGAAPVPVSLIETYAAMGIEIHQVYGLTETFGHVTRIAKSISPRSINQTNSWRNQL